MPFNIKNSPSIFQRYINNMLYKFLNIFITVYINNILIYLSLLFKYQKYIRCHGIVLTRTVSYYFLLLAGPPLAPWRLPLLFVYNTPFYLLLLFIPQCSYSAYQHYSTITVCGISSCAPLRSLFSPIHCPYFPSIIATWRDR